MRAFVFTFIFLLFSGVGVSAQEAADPAKIGVKELYLARDNGKGKAGEPATSFVVTDMPIYCVVMLNTSESVSVKMNLVAVSVAGVKPETQVVSTIYTTKDFEDRVNFSGKPRGRWVAGRYRVDVFIANSLVASREFAIQTSAMAKPAPQIIADPKVAAKPKIPSRSLKP